MPTAGFIALLGAASPTPKGRPYELLPASSCRLHDGMRGVRRSLWATSGSVSPPTRASWLRSALSTNYAAVTEMMNAYDTNAGRRNQVLYCLGKIASDTLRHSDVEEILRKEFPNSTTGITLNVPAVLAEIARGGNPAIKRTPKGDSYRFVAPRFRMCIRTMLVKTGEKVTKIDLSKL